MWDWDVLECKKPCGKSPAFRAWSSSNNVNLKKGREGLIKGIHLFEAAARLYTQLMQLRKESLPGLYRIRTLDLCDTGAALYQLS